jgi:hypothetical protein
LFLFKRGRKKVIKSKMFQKNESWFLRNPRRKGRRVVDVRLIAAKG